MVNMEILGWHVDKEHKTERYHCGMYLFMDETTYGRYLQAALAREPQYGDNDCFMIHTKSPHFLLFSQADSPEESHLETAGRWRFKLQSLETKASFEASDYEPDMGGERLELLSVVRGLEALEQPSQVTLITTSRRVSRGLRQGINQWRENSWRWEYFGRLTPVKNGDLWQRIERASQIHDINCHEWHSLSGVDTEELFLETPDVINHPDEAVSAPEMPHILDNFAPARESHAAAVAAPAEVEAKILTHNTVARAPKSSTNKAIPPSEAQVSPSITKSLIRRSFRASAAAVALPFNLVNVTAFHLGMLVLSLRARVATSTIKPRLSQHWTGSMERTRA